MSVLRTFVPTIAVAALVGMSGPKPVPPASVVTIVATDFEFEAPATVLAWSGSCWSTRGKQLHQ